MQHKELIYLPQNYNIAYKRQALGFKKAANGNYLIKQREFWNASLLYFYSCWVQQNLLQEFKENVLDTLSSGPTQEISMLLVSH